MKNFIYLFLLFCISCSVPEARKPKSEKPLIAVSVPSYLFFVRRIAQNTAEVKNLIPAEADPHHFEPSAKHLDLAVRAKIWFSSKESFEEEFKPRILPYNQNLKICDLTEGLPVINGDLHLWLSPKIAVLQAEKIEKVLENTFPENAKLYRKNLKELVQEIKAADGEIAEKLKTCKNKTILVSHSAFTYFCKDYGLQQLSVEDENHKEPSLKDFYHLFQKAKKQNASKVFIQAQVDNKGAYLIADKLNLSPVMVDPYSENYLENLKKIADIIAQED